MDATCTSERSVCVASLSRHGLAWWLAPDLALIVSIVVLLCQFTVFDGSGFFGDSDAGWHIRTGEGILNGQGLPRTDSYSFLKSGEPWFAWEWGSDVLMGFFHQRGGLAGVAVLYAAALAAAVWLWFRLNLAMGGHFLIAAAFTPLLLLMTRIHWHARPHLLSWLFLLGAVWYAERPRRSLWIVAVASALWANIHASFFLGIVICLIYAAGSFVRPLIWEAEYRNRSWRDAAWFAGAACIAGIATLANPYGWEVHRHILRYSADTELLSRVSEFQSFNYFQGGALAMILGLVAAAIGGVLSFAQRRPERALLVLFFFAMAVRSVRGLPIAALLCLPVANAAITAALRNASHLHPWLRRKVAALIAYGDDLRRLDARFAGPLAAFAAIVLLWIAVRNTAVGGRVGFSKQDYPVAAAGRLAGLQNNMRLLAPDDYGGYLIYRFSGRIKVYIDGRSDFYGAQYSKSYLDLIGLRPGWRDKVANAGFTHSLLPKSYSLNSALEEIGWKRLYSDDVAVILEAPTRLARSRTSR